MTQLILVPLEPLTERYTESWYRNFPPLFAQAGFDVVVVDGEPLLHNEIRTGTFLDINSTVHYKMTQLQSIARMFNDGEVAVGAVFFFSDIEFWGLESVRLLAQMNQVPIKMCGFLHAASYTVEDAFSVAAPYQQYTEMGWLVALDRVFVGSQYHKHAIESRRLIPQKLTALLDRIKVTGNPIFLADYTLAPVPRAKKKKMLLTNRFDSEKRPGETMDLFEELHDRFPDWELVITTSRPTLRSNDPKLSARAYALHRAGVVTVMEGLTKTEYHQQLQEAAIVVSHSIEENYGYCIAEALLYKALPLLRAGLSHDEFVNGDKRLLFHEHGHDDFTKACALMKAFGTAHWPRSLSLRVDGGHLIVNEVLKLAIEKGNA